MPRNFFNNTLSKAPIPCVLGKVLNFSKNSVLQRHNIEHRLIYAVEE